MWFEDLSNQAAGILNCRLDGWMVRGGCQAPAGDTCGSSRRIPRPRAPGAALDGQCETASGPRWPVRGGLAPSRRLAVARAPTGGALGQRELLSIIDISCFKINI
ncbi:hypothetical protein PVAP13_3KG470202 [Panicum virgatum]|uniref:Uncharacterized protein n=1 Tax=Panicum virgatum TaxID=38727 RepID=A0A8T0VAJ3_PANVG|nr:hypothetical protein PVAP13_3KG470202 [Panicum virgatum]